VELLQLILDGLSLGAAYALIALGFVLVLNATNVIAILNGLEDADLVERRRRAAGEDHRGAVPGQETGRGGTNAGPAARHNGNPAMQVEWILGRHCRLTSPAGRRPVVRITAT